MVSNGFSLMLCFFNFFLDFFFNISQKKASESWLISFLNTLLLGCENKLLVWQVLLVYKLHVMANVRNNWVFEHCGVLTSWFEYVFRKLKSNWLKPYLCFHYTVCLTLRYKKNERLNTFSSLGQIIVKK